MKTVRYKWIKEIECLHVMFILQVDLQRKFEKMMLDEHITNLYAPRILASQTTTDGISNPGFQNEKQAQKGVNKDARKSFRKAVKKSQWQSIKVKNYQDPTFLKKDIANHLNNKAKRSQTMGARALEQLWEKGGVDAPVHHAQSVQRTRSSNSEFGRKMLSTNATLIKVSTGCPKKNALPVWKQLLGDFWIPQVLSFHLSPRSPGFCACISEKISNLDHCI